MKEKKEKTTTNKIADSIRRDINYSKLKPGTKLIEREIAARYEASHIPVREAFRILEGEGYLQHFKFAGYVVREVSPAELMELYDVLRFLSDHLLSVAIPRYSQITYYQLESLVVEFGIAKENDSRIQSMIRFIETAYAPAQLNYSYELALKILHQNIPILQIIMKEFITKGSHEAFQRNFIAACQTKGAEVAVKVWNDYSDVQSKRMIALLSNEGIPERGRKVLDNRNQ